MAIATEVKLLIYRQRLFSPEIFCGFIEFSTFKMCTLFVKFPSLQICSKRRGDREAEGARLEIVCTATYRGFESLLLRQHFFHISCMVWEKV
jgi:hypothetical protein